MPIDNGKTPRIALSAIIEGLVKAEVKFILVGGLAAVIQGAPVTTMDVDIVPEQSPENIATLFSFLQSIEAIYRRSDNKVIAPKKEDFAGRGHILLTTCLGPLDVLTFIEQNKNYEDLFADAIAIEFRGCTVHVLDLEKIIELKKNSSNLKDKQRLPVLEETLRQLKEALDHF